MVTVTLYRPVGPKELELIEASGWKRFPPRLPEQPIFYPVLNAEYAAKIAREWNVKESGRGIVTRFAVDADFVGRYPVHTVGSAICQELWVPAEDMKAFNDHIVGKIEVVAEFEEPHLDPAFSIRLERVGLLARNLVYEEPGHKLVIYLEASGVKEHDWVGCDTSFRLWNSPAGHPIPAAQQAEILSRIAEWGRGHELRFGFGPPVDLNAFHAQMQQAGHLVQRRGDGATEIVSKVKIKAEADTVRAIVNEWNPIGITCPPDEYDCLVDQIVSLLHRGTTEDRLGLFISSEFADHFGMPVAASEVTRVATQVFSWWQQSRGVR